MTDTASRGVSPRRPRYDEGCPIGGALNVVGDRWAFLVVRELTLQPKRFQTLREGLPGVTPGVLSGRLEQLAEAGIVDRDDGLGIYSLTAAGQALRPVLGAMARWGFEQGEADLRKFVSPTSLMLSMALMIDPAKAAGADPLAGFEVGREAYLVCLKDGVPVPQPARDPRAPFVLTGPGNAIGMALYGPRPVADVVASGVVSLRGDADAAQGFADLFRKLSPPPG